MKLEAKSRLTAAAVPVCARCGERLIHSVEADVEDPLGDGVIFDTLIDGEPGEDPPAVQTVTKDDGTTEEAPEQDLLNDDLVVPNIKFAS